MLLPMASATQKLRVLEIHVIQKPSTVGEHLETKTTMKNNIIKYN